MYRLKTKKNAFTLAETIIVCSIFAIMVMWIILWINRGFLFMNNTKVLVRATNFAREGVEIVYNIRDTNRRKNSWEKDKHRMDAGTGVDKLNSWMYVIKEYENNWDLYYYAEKINGVGNDFYWDDFRSGWYTSQRISSKIMFPWTYSYYSWGVIETWNLEDLLWWAGIEFYRVLRVYGVYCKNSPTLDPDDSSSCSDDSDPKEIRFCVKVFYEFNGWHHASELCSIMTNFME